MDTISYSLSGSVSDAGPACGPAPLPSTAPGDAERDRGRELQTPEAQSSSDTDGSTFLELRRKVQESELLSGATERLLRKMKFNGHLRVVVQHGRVVKSGYEEGYFRRRSDLSGVILQS